MLANPLTVRPLPMNRASVYDLNVVGKPARYVGYGRTDSANDMSGGIKRQFTAPIAQVNDRYLRVSPNAHGACSGDSGGPLFMDTGNGETIVGVTSFGDSNDCGKDSFFQRLDSQIAWVDKQLAQFDPGTAGGNADAGGPPVPPPDAAVAVPPDSAAQEPPPKAEGS